ncbi:SigB/SigF/SigG family RNA polymerase sigma factor [Mycolicibacterium tusciae]|uniref:SigB/SigF/SigG family RNA polymerase sigma factor n=1 Tax=Mycolicibacterium tusciae TaxID=75922 RepID=UPI00024A4F49|nr:SigB/SigF/SigG family RNA polymerase sigma factor [Mycolicibacterium tusciae]
MDEPSEYADVAEMIRHLRTFDDQSVQYRRQRDAIVERCLPLAEHIARRYRNRGEPLDDLIQTARMGLVHAVNRFNVDNGADFLAFAVPTVAGEVRRHFRDHGWAVKVPRRVKDLQAQLNKARNDLSHELRRAPNATEIAEHLGIDRDLVIDATFAGSNYSVLSTDSTSGSDETYPSVADRLGKIDAGIDKVLQVETVRPLIAALPERQRTVLTLRFFEDMTQTEIANHIGCSQMHVSRLLAKALETLRRQVRASELAATG